MSQKDNFDRLVSELITPQIKELEVDVSKPPIRNTGIKLQENAKEIFNRRYRRRDVDGNYTESIEETYLRVASHIASAEETAEGKHYFTNLFYNLLTDLDWIPNAPTWTGSATPLGQLAACFVLPIEDDMGSHPDGIFMTLRNASLIQKSGGGNGFSFSRLRPRGDVVKSSMGKATGPVGFLEVYDSAFNEIAQGGARRGANMAVLRVDHPDVREFIKCKTEEGTIKNFNISVAITDKFMEAVKNDTDFELINPRTGEVWEKVPAREIFDLIVKYAHRNGEPGVLFIDEANRDNPVPNQYSLEATNPCGEQWLGPYENCCLGHINLANHARMVDGRYEIDWTRLAETTHVTTRFLDNVVSVNGYVPAVPQLKDAAYRNRRIGLGYAGLADLMYMLGVRYGSSESAELSAQLTEFIRYHSMLESVALSKQRGPFPGIIGSIYDPKNVLWQIPKPLNAYQRNWGRPIINWEEVMHGIKENGIRNSTQMTVAPTGSTATVLGVEGYGCEPVFALAYYRNVYQAAGMQENLTLKYVSPIFQAKLNELDIDQKTKDKIIDQVLEKGGVQEIQELPKELRDVFVVSADISPEEHVILQASIQAFIDNSISKTCNFPEQASEDDVRQAYFLAWENGCKGLTVYRTGSRDEVVLETKETKDKKLAGTQELETNKITFALRPRDKVLQGETHRVDTPLGNMYLTVNKTEEGEYHEVFINLGKAGTDVRADTEAMGKLISLIFRLGTVDGNQRMKAIIGELDGISSGMVSGFNSDRVLSVPDAIAKALKRVDSPETFAEQTELGLFGPTSVSTAVSVEPSQAAVPKITHPATNKSQKGLCPMCGNYSVLMIEGCKKCSVQLGGCGEYSAC
jgi:ribonucleoside-diphosphate reductase alpha chain